MTEQLMKFHAKCAEKCVQVGKAHEVMAKCHKEMAKTEDADYHRDLCDAHSSAAEGFAGLAEEHLALAKTIGEIPPTAGRSDIPTNTRSGDALLDAMYGDLNKTSTRLVPTNVRLVAADSAKGGGAMLIPRTGAPAVVESTGVPPEFLELFDTSED